MNGGFFQFLTSAIVGAVAAVGVSWYMSVSDSNAKDEGRRNIKAGRVEADSIVVSDSILIVHPETREPLLELRDGCVFAQKNVFAEQVSAFRMLGQKLQTTPDDPFDQRASVYGELAVNDDGGAYVALLSPRESHSVTIGFDKQEKGCIVSQNNDDMSMVAQAIFLKPNRQKTGVASVSAEKARENAPQRVDAPEAAQENRRTPLKTSDRRLENLSDSLQR